MVEAYVRRKLAPQDYALFEEHYFQCGQCFDEVQVAEKFVAGVEHAARTGLLDPVREPGPEKRWLWPAFAFAVAAAVVLAAGLAWFAFVRVPDREARLEQALNQAKTNAGRVAELAQRAAVDAGPEANVPLAILTASRSTDSPNQLQLAAESRRVVLWIDVPPQPPGTRFGVSVSPRENAAAAPVVSIHGLERNSSGALAVSLPAANLPPGAWQVRLFKDASPGQSIAEYRLNVERK
jgi:hypothetical protein